MSRLFVKLLAATMALLVNGQVVAANWVQQAGSTLRFSGEQQGEVFEGGFGRFDATIQFDPAALAAARFDVSIDIGSADTANSERDETMLGADFFDSKHFPKAEFTAQNFREIAPGRFEADASLRIRDRTVALKFPFDWISSAEGAQLRAKVELDRLAFGIGTGEWEDADTIGHKVTVTVSLKLKPGQAP